MTEMQEAQSHDASEGTIVQTTVVKEMVHCRRCGSDGVYRAHRKGFMQERIYPLFGYYPWECKRCRGQVLLRKRHKVVRTRAEQRTQ